MSQEDFRLQRGVLDAGVLQAADARRGALPPASHELFFQQARLLAGGDGVDERVEVAVQDARAGCAA